MRSEKRRTPRKLTVEISEELYAVLVAYDKRVMEMRSDEERKELERMGVPLHCPKSMGGVLLEEKLRELAREESHYHH